MARASPNDARFTAFCVRLRREADGKIAVSAEHSSEPGVPEQIVTLGNDFHLSYADFLERRCQAVLKAGEPENEMLRDLRTLGDSIGNAVFAGEVGAALIRQLQQAASAGEELELVFETADPYFLSIPFEAARLPNGRTPALESGVRLLRRLSGKSTTPRQPQAGPLEDSGGRRRPR